MKNPAKLPLIGVKKNGEVGRFLLVSFTCGAIGCFKVLNHIHSGRTPG
jgi:hypothetical protein